MRKYTALKHVFYFFFTEITTEHDYCVERKNMYSYFHSFLSFFGEESRISTTKNDDETRLEN